jgi:mannosyltransferase
MTIAPQSAFYISRPIRYALLVALLLLAFFLRFYRLDEQSFWNDEGNSARIAERPVRLIVAGAGGDIHPPGYYLLLHYWRALFGHTEFALRAFSAMCGVVMLAFTYLLGRRLFDPTTGLTAAFLGAISPLAVYYAQEARMYALLGALSAISTYLFLRLLPRPGLTVAGRERFAYVLAAAAGLYTQYAFPFVLIVHNVVFGLWWLIRIRRAGPRWRRLLVWIGFQLAVAALYLPWLPTAIRSVTGWSPAGRSYELIPALFDMLRVLSVGVTLPTERAVVALVTAGALLIVGLLGGSPIGKPAPGRRETIPSPVFNIVVMAIYLLLPIALILTFDLYKSEWLKFLIVILSPFHILLAHAIHRHPSLITLSLAFILALCIPTAISLHNLYFDPAYRRDDYRQIAADVETYARPADGIILNAPNQWEVFTYYYPDHYVYPAPYHPTPKEVDAFLTPLLADHRRLFVLYWGDAEADPRRLIESALSRRAYKARDWWYGRVRLSIYGTAPLSQAPQSSLDAHFGGRTGDRITLRGYALADVDEAFAPGDVVPLTLFWQAHAPVAGRYKVTVQLLDGQGHLVAQQDTEPRDGLLPTSDWQPDRALADHYGVWLPSALPPGDYPLFVGLYDVHTGERLPVTADDQPVDNNLLPLRDIRVIPPDARLPSLLTHGRL